MSQKTIRSILPFSTLSENRRKPFTEKIEKAAIFCLAELERVKGGGLVLKQPPEKLTFIAQVCYPFWLVTLDKTGLLFDALCTTSQTWTYLRIPDIQVFLDNVKRSSKTRHAYMTFLSDNINYFQVASNEERKIIDGLIIGPEFLHDFIPYLSEVTPVKTSLSNMVTVSPTLDESSIASIIEGLQSLKSKFTHELNALYSSMKLLSAETENFMKAIRGEIRKVEDKLNTEIGKRRASIDKEVDEIRREYDERVTEHSKELEEELFSLQQEKIKLEKIKEQLTDEVERCGVEVKTSAISKDSASEHRWREEKSKLKKQLSETETELRELDKGIKEVKDEKNLKIFELKSERDAEIKEAMKDLVEIESSRDAKIRVYEEEMEKFEELTSSMIEQIDRLAKLREKSVDEFNRLGVPQKRRKRALIYMPFYLVCYQSESGKRYVHFSPSIVSNVSLSARFKGAFGKAKIKQLLQPRSKKIVSLLNKFPLLMEQNAVFNREMTEACVKANLMRTKQSRESIKEGLEMLKEEGWFSEKECESLSQMST